MSETAPTVNRFGPYVVIEKLGTGGMSLVYRAINEETQNTVALKILRNSLVEQPGVVDRFKQEAEISNRLRHPHIVAVNTWGSIKGRYFLEMQYFPGGTLAERFRTPVEMGPQEAIRLLRHVASALDYAHRQNVIHRDLKLENILLDRRGDAALSDFGIARILDGDRLTATGNIVGTPYYISPEQARGEKNLDHRADLYSLAVIAYVLTVGHFPFSGENMLAVMNQHVAEPVPPPSQINLDLPRSIDNVLIKGMAKRREERYSSADTFVEALSRAFSDHKSRTTLIDLWSEHSGNQVVINHPIPTNETADDLYEKAKAAATENPVQAIGYLKRALDLEPLHSNANRMLLQLEGVNPINRPHQPALPPVSEEELEPLKKVNRGRRRSGWTWVAIIATVLMSMTSLFFVLSFTGSPIAARITEIITGKRPINEIAGTPVKDIPHIVLTVEPQEIKKIAPQERMSAVLDSGIAHEYYFDVQTGQEMAIAVWFVSPTANRVAKNVAILNSGRQDITALCQHDVLIPGSDTSVILTCRIDQTGTWRVRIFGIDGESTGAYFVSVENMAG
jgi:serine/threonine protein kinase